jgi:Ca2+-binding EF-hand superfamily protein
VSTASTAPITGRNGNGNALSQLQNAQVRTLREGFQILDRDSDGVVNREDVTDMLNQLGKRVYPQSPFSFVPSSSLSYLVFSRLGFFQIGS